MTILVAHPLGHVGFVSFVKALHRLGVLDHDELLGWLRLPGQIIRLLETPLHDGSGVDEETFAGLLLDLGAEEMP